MASSNRFQLCQFIDPHNVGKQSLNYFMTVFQAML
jgi:hypothetical protein